MKDDDGGGQLFPFGAVRSLHMGKVRWPEDRPSAPMLPLHGVALQIYRMKGPPT